MATKTFNDICVEYAHQLGKGLPLTPAEMCNAVIMYLNAQITEMQGITTALQTAVAEAEESATEATNSANELSVKVDTLQTAVTEAESSATEAINKANDVSETVNALPKVPTPTTTDNGKVIGVQSGAYALVEQSGGEAPANMVTTDTQQTINGQKTFQSVIKLSSIYNVYNNILYETSITATGHVHNVGYPNTDIIIKGKQEHLQYNDDIIANISDIPDLSTPASVEYVQETGATIVYGTDNPKELALPIIAGDNVTIAPDESDSHLIIGIEGVAKLGPNGGLEVTSNGNSDCVIRARNSNHAGDFTCMAWYGFYFHNEEQNANVILNAKYTANKDAFIYFPCKSGDVALISDLPSLDNYSGYIDIINGTAGSGIRVHDTVKASPYTKYGYYKIETYGNSNSLRYTLNIPNKNGTIATLDDISNAPSSDKYFTRVIYHSTDEDTQYIIFSCITDTDLSANTGYQNAIDLLNNLGATTQDTALTCTGKTVSGGIVVGVYTDGTNIIVFDTDNSSEELNMSSEIKFISK